MQEIAPHQPRARVSAHQLTPIKCGGCGYEARTAL